MSESVLKKEFSQRDIQRLRNLVQGKYGEKTSVSTGYLKSDVKRTEGEVWEENDKVWTVKNGIKQNISKLQQARKIGMMPLFCPKCNGKTSHVDRAPFQHFRHCLNCQAKFETELKATGKWEDYQNQQHNQTVDATIQEYENWFEDYIRESNNGFVTEQGDVEQWSAVNLDMINKQKEETLAYLQSLKK